MTWLEQYKRAYRERNREELVRLLKERYGCVPAGMMPIGVW